MTIKAHLTPSGARRLGDDYQDIAALELLIDWLEHPDRYQWIKAEAGVAGSLDDVIALKSDGSVIGRQIKYSNHPDATDDPYTWESLLSKATTASRSLLRKWADSLSELASLGDLSEASVVSNRRASPGLIGAMAGSDAKKIDFDKISNDATRQAIISQLGSESQARQFFSDFDFNLNAPSLNALEAGVWRRFEKVGGTELGWHSLKKELSRWTYYRNEPPPNGEITLADIRNAALWNQTTGALSLTPVSSRPLVDLPLIGREADLKWLVETEGDRVLVGAPGCGKTFLLREFTKAGNIYFLVDHDRARMLTALRASRPMAIIVDDAHLRTDSLTSLRHIRTENGMDFSIVASCWPGAKENVAHALALPENKCHDLPLLTRDEIAEVISATRLLGPDRLVQEIVEQAEGRPGLAVTLSLLCLEGDARKVALGDALSESIRNSIEPFVGKEATGLLAAFAVGGATGMPIDSISSLVGMPPLTVRQSVAGLAAGGVIIEAGSECLAVTPAGLRHALVRDVFFAGPYSLPIAPYLAAAPNQNQAVRTLIGVRSRGGDVPDPMLLPLLDAEASSELWRMYACLGEPECSYVLREHPGLTGRIVDAALEYVPQTILPILLDTASEDTRPLHSNPDHAFRRIEDWIRSFVPGTIERRRILIEAIEKWLASGGDALTASRALAHALPPRLEELSMRPGSGNQFAIPNRLMTEQEIQEMSRVWLLVCNVLSGLVEADWNVLVSAIENWAFPRRFGISEKQPVWFSVLRKQAQGMVHDLAHIASGHPGVLNRLKEIGTRIGLKDTIIVDPDYATLFPSDSHDDVHTTEVLQKEDVEALAEVWSARPADPVMRKLLEYEREATASGHGWPRWTPYLCQQMASRVTSSIDWARIFVQNNAPADLATAFVRHAVNGKEPGWEALLSECLEIQPLAYECLYLMLGMPRIPSSIEGQAVAMLAEHKVAIITACSRDEVSTEMAAMLLAHEEESVRSAAAIGVWCAPSKGSVPVAVSASWRAAILESSRLDGSDMHWLVRILKQDTNLAREWIEARLSEDPNYYFVENELLPVFDALEPLDRMFLLTRVQEGGYADEMIRALVGRSVEAFEALLNIEHLKDYHLAPLSQVEVRPKDHPDADQFRHENVWNDMTVHALDAGYSSEEVADALMPVSFGGGSESSIWQQWADGFNNLISHEDERVRDVSRIGTEIFFRYRDSALATEHRRAVRGE